MAVTENATEQDRSFLDATGNVLPENREREILDWCQKRFNTAKKNRQQFERVWYMNLAFYFGRQYAQWSTRGNNGIPRLFEPPVPPWRVRLVSNKVRPIVRTELAKVTKEKPQAFVVPSSTDDEDLFAARGGEALFEYFWRVLTLNKIMRRTQFWNIICGTSFTKDWYDQDLVDAAGIPGSLSVEPVSPFHLYVPDTQEEEIENQPFVVHVLAKDPEWIKDNFNKSISPDSTGSSGILEQRFLTAIGINSNVHKDYVAVHEMWIKPNRRFPDGAVVTWAGEKILNIVESWPYQHGEYPFQHYIHIPTGRFYGDSTIPDLIPLQKEYNRTRSQIIEAKNRMAKPQLMAPRGSVDPTKITSEPGLIVFYTPGYQPPTPIPLQSIPSYVIDELDRCQRDMDDISSQHEITKGRTPPGVTAATAIAYLQEEDDSKLSFTISSLEEGVEKLGRHFLSHVQQFWDAQRTVEIMGNDGQWEQLMFGKADLKGNTDLRVEAGSATPRSRAAKQAFIMELADKGMIPPDRALKYLDMAETGRLYEETMLDTRHAQRENIRLRNGDLEVAVNDWDNHEVHIIEHNNFRKRSEFEKLPDEIQMAFQQHVEQHKMVMTLEQTGMALPEGMPMPGGNPARPQPESPQ